MAILSPSTGRCVPIFLTSISTTDESVLYHLRLSIITFRLSSRLLSSVVHNHSDVIILIVISELNLTGDDGCLLSIMLHERFSQRNITGYFVVLTVCEEGTI